MPIKKPRRLGRPPASSSLDTRDRILEIALDAFSELGYEATTNKYIATKAAITTGALYHYFDSKVEIYKAVYERVQDRIYERFSASLQDVEGFVARLEAVLEAAHTMNSEDPSIARFVGAARVDMARHDEVRVGLGRPAEQGADFFAGLVDHGIATGEIDPANRELVRAFVRIMVVGLTDAVSHDQARHRIAVDAIRAAVEGRLISTPLATSVAKKRRS